MMGGPLLAFDVFFPTGLPGPKSALLESSSPRARRGGAAPAAMCGGRWGGRPGEPPPYMYSETGALEMV